MVKNPQARLLNIIMAFGHFSEKPYAALDHAKVLTAGDFDTIEDALRALAKSLRGEVALGTVPFLQALHDQNVAEMHKLAEQIENDIA